MLVRARPYAFKICLLLSSDFLLACWWVSRGNLLTIQFGLHLATFYDKINYNFGRTCGCHNNSLNHQQAINKYDAESFLANRHQKHVPSANAAAEACHLVRASTAAILHGEDGGWAEMAHAQAPHAQGRPSARTWRQPQDSGRPRRGDVLLTDWRRLRRHR